MIGYFEASLYNKAYFSISSHFCVLNIFLAFNIQILKLSFMVIISILANNERICNARKENVMDLR